MLGAPELDAVLQVGSHESRVKWQNHLPQPAGHASLAAAQDTVGFLGCKRTLSAHVELLIHFTRRYISTSKLPDYMLLLKCYVFQIFL